METTILLMARAWGIPPWQVEAECSQEWWDWFNDYAVESARRQAEDAKRLTREARRKK